MDQTINERKQNMKIHLYGDTYNVRESVKKDGFSWDKDHKRWSKDIDQSLYDRIVNGETSAIVEAKANKKGCCVVIFTPEKYKICWESKIFIRNNKFYKSLPCGYCLGFDEL